CFVCFVAKFLSMRVDESLRATLSILGGWFGFLAGALAAAWGVTLFFRSTPPGGSFAVIGDWARSLLFWGIFGGAIGAIIGWNLTSALCRWLNKPPEE